MGCGISFWAATVETARNVIKATYEDLIAKENTTDKHR
jgi:hypothetical protein